MDDELVLDGNGMDGLLGEILATEPSTVMRTCHHCGDEQAMGAHRAFRGAGVVLRCPSCDAAAMLIGVQEHRLVVEARGVFALARPA